MRINGFRQDGSLSLNAHQIGGTTVYLGLVVRTPPQPFPPTNRNKRGQKKKKMTGRHTGHCYCSCSHPPRSLPTLSPAVQLGFYLLQTPAVEHATARLALQAAYAAVGATVVGAFLKAAGTDPADDTRNQVRARVRACRARALPSHAAIRFNPPAMHRLCTSGKAVLGGLRVNPISVALSDTRVARTKLALIQT
jgi:hypothetical protein